MPVVLAQAGQLTTQFADTAMVGRFGGEDPLPLAAVSLGSALFLIIIYLGALGLALGITPIIGEHFARGDKRRVAHLLQNSMLYCTVVGIAATAAALLVRPLMWSLSDVLTPQNGTHDIGDVVALAVPYFDMLTWSILLPLMIFLSFKQFLEGIGNTSIAMWIVLATNALNILLNWVFIFGHLGAEPMGAEGAGLATLISRIAQMLSIAWIVMRSRRFAVYRSHFARRVLRWQPIREILRVGYPTAFQMMLEASAFITTTILALSFGAVSSSAFQITFNIANIAWMIIVAVGSASTIVVSHIYGSGEFGRLRPTIRATFHIGLAWSILMAAMFILLRGSIPALFTDNEEVIALTGYLLIYISVYQISDGIQGLFDKHPERIAGREDHHADRGGGLCRSEHPDRLYACVPLRHGPRRPCAGSGLRTYDGRRAYPSAGAAADAPARCRGTTSLGSGQRPITACPGQGRRERDKYPLGLNIIRIVCLCRTKFRYLRKRETV